LCKFSLKSELTLSVGRSSPFGGGDTYALELWIGKIDGCEGVDEDIEWLDSPLPVEENASTSMLGKLASCPEQFFPSAYLLGSRGLL